MADKQNEKKVVQIFVYVSAFLLVVNACFVSSSTICDATKNTDVRHFDIRLPVTKVPEKTTHYICQIFKVPEEATYHAVAFEPLISKSRMVHHMLLFACDFEPETLEPHECSSYDAQCRSWLAQWTIGVDGQICTDKNAGVRFGKNSHTYMALQVHYDNSEKRSNVTDNSGMRIFYTTKMRQFDVGNVQIGQNDLEIPPMSAFHKQYGGCSSTCTSLMLPHPIYLTRTYIHMHYLGARGILEVYRNKTKVEVIALDKEYHYDPSPIHVHDPAVEIRPVQFQSKVQTYVLLKMLGPDVPNRKLKPKSNIDRLNHKPPDVGIEIMCSGIGDEVRLTCWFNSKTGQKMRNHTVYWGEGSDAEMCYAFVTYYPHVQGFDQCIQFASYDMNCPTEDHPLYGGCDFRSFQVYVQSEVIPKVFKSCNLSNLCSSECSTKVDQVSGLYRHKCMEGRLGAYVKRQILPQVTGWTQLETFLQIWDMHCIVLII